MNTIVTGVFVALGWSTILPLPHIMYLHGMWLVWGVAKWELLVGLIYTVGAVMYAKRIPERWSPGKYDTSFVRSLFPPHVHSLNRSLSLSLPLAAGAYHCDIRHVQLCSHSLWHCFTIAGALTQLYACLTVYDVFGSMDAC
jgi:predicted membrane channel-forming protein YqfA (hemolysin III family)